MDALLLLLICGGGYLVAYHTYGKFLSRKVFGLRPDAPVPSRELEDGVDYVPSRPGVIFGHHFTSIAGTGPIVGPAIALIWGWLPAILWVVFGCIFMGAVHDFGTLVVSLRNEGKSISEIAARYINRRVRMIFFLIVFFTLLIVIAIFGVIIATVFDDYPESVAAIWLQIPIAVWLGRAIYRKKANVTISTVIAVSGMYAFVLLGAWLEHLRPGLTSLPTGWPIPPTGVWTLILLGYCFFASTLPVTTLLQPRDYMNAWQLFIMMALLVVATAASAFSSADFTLSAPVYQSLSGEGPSLMPMMFVIIACGAISGFHSLVASGTTPKQISSEPDARFIGYGSMLTEGLLAVLSIICIAAGVGMGYEGLTGRAAWSSLYPGWSAGKGVEPVVIGAANMMGSLGIPQVLGFAIMGVFISSFASTTLDTAVRIQRYVIGEISTDLNLPRLSNRWTATTVAVLTAAGLAFATGADGRGAFGLWPLFGTVNQLLAALALLVVTMYLRSRKGYYYLTAALPCLFMLAMTGWAMILSEIDYFRQSNWLLLILGGVILLLAAWMTVETAILFVRPAFLREAASRRSEEPAVSLPTRGDSAPE